MTRPQHLGLHHAALFVPDLAAARAFWVDLMGYVVEWEPDPDNVYLCSGADNLALHTGEPPVGAQRLDHLGVIVATADDVAAWEAFLRGHGVEIVQATKLHRDGATSCYVRDPAGTLVQILHHPPISGRLQDMSRPSAPS